MRLYVCTVCQKIVKLIESERKTTNAFSLSLLQKATTTVSNKSLRHILEFQKYSIINGLSSGE